MSEWPQTSNVWETYTKFSGTSFGAKIGGTIIMTSSWSTSMRPPLAMREHKPLTW